MNDVDSPIPPPRTPQDIEIPDVLATQEHPVIAAPTIHRIDDSPTPAPEQNLADGTGL